jgi:hypothetical protein
LLEIYHGAFIVLNIVQTKFLEKFPVLLLKGKRKKGNINPLVLLTNSEVHKHSCTINVESTPVYEARGGAVVEALRYKLEGRGINSQWFHFNISLTNTCGRTMALGSTQPLIEISTRNVSRGKGDRYLELTTLPPSSADCLKNWEPQPPGTLKACNGIALRLYTTENLLY